MQILIVLFFIFLTYKFGDWRNWQKYYSTILFYGFFDLLHNCIYFNQPLWEFTCSFGIDIPHMVFELIWIFFVFTSTVLVYIPHFPQKPIPRVLYILLWVLIYSAVEWILYLTKGFIYYNGWSIWASILFNCCVFPILWVHYKKPAYAWFMTAVMAIFILMIFDIPLSKIR